MSQSFASTSAPNSPVAARSSAYRVDDAFELKVGAVRITAIYLALGLAWIFLSDLALAAVIEDAATLSTIQSVKGVAFVTVTALVIYAVVQRDGRVIRGAERELVLANERLDELAAFPQLLPSPIVELDADGSVVYQNDAARAAGYGEDVWGLLPVGARDMARKAIDDHQPVTGIKSEVAGRTFAWGIFPVPRWKRAYVYGLDVTLEHAYHARLAQADKLDTVGRLAAGLAHDFRSALTVVKGYVTAMAEDYRDGDPVKEDLRVIEQATDRAETLLQRLFALTTEAGAPEVIDVGREVKGFAPLLRHLVPRDVRIDVQAQDEARALIDPAQLGRVLSNLLVNAGDALRGQDGGTVELRVAAAGGRVTIKVGDDGPGMGEETLARVFEPFFTTKERGAGTGLGLPTVRDIVEDAGGTIRVESTPGHGSTFHVELPEAAAE